MTSLSIAEAAEQTGPTAHTLRYYERDGLMLRSCATVSTDARGGLDLERARRRRVEHMTTPDIGQRTLGTASPLSASTLGLGCMGISEFCGTPDEQGGTDTIHRALDLGVTFLDTADRGLPIEETVGAMKELA